MKFWKILRNLINQTLPDWQDKFLSYKELKQHLNLIYPNKENNILGNETPNKQPRMSREDARQTLEAINEFMNLLRAEINKFNKFVMKKEEMYNIRLQLENRTEDDGFSWRDDSVGELQCSQLHRTGEYLEEARQEKQRGSSDSTFVQIIVQQPFLRTQMIKDLVKECESMVIYHIFSGHQHQEPHVPKAYCIGLTDSEENKEWKFHCQHLLHASDEGF